MSDKIKLGVNGAAGRMGQRIVALAHADADLAVAAAYEWEKSPHQGRDAGEIAGVGLDRRAYRGPSSAVRST